MFGNAFGWPHLLVILALVLLLFGAPKLPGLAKSIGQSMRIFRKEVKTMKDETAEESDEIADDDADESAAAKPSTTKSSTAKKPPTKS